MDHKFDTSKYVKLPPRACCQKLRVEYAALLKLCETMAVAADNLHKALRKDGAGFYSKTYIEDWLVNDVKPAVEQSEQALQQYQEWKK